MQQLKRLRRSSQVELTSSWATVAGLRWHAIAGGQQHRGQRPTVVLVHGLGVSSRYFEPGQRLLAREFHVVAPDLPGFGRTAHPPEVLDTAGLASALEAWLTAIAIDRAAFIGNSLGCQVIVALARLHPERVACAVLNGPTYDCRARTLWQQAWRLLLDAPRERPSQTLVVLGDYLLRCGPRRFIQTFCQSLPVALEAQARDVAAPVMVLCGSRDPIAPPDWCAALARQFPQGECRLLTGAAHTPLYSHPAIAVSAIRPYLHQHS
jgi:2-hydroxy-6-oxonona-2,4-dienedioate hydrolase